MRIGIDATNIGAGGGITHLKELLLSFNENEYKGLITSITVFGSDKTLNEIDNFVVLSKVTFPELNKGLLSRVFFQLTKFDRQIRSRCDLLFSLTGDYIGNFKPLVGMSQNMLLYERDIWKDIKQPKEIIRFWINFKKQKRCFNNAAGIIFISQYAQNYISNKINIVGKEISIIHHGISPRFAGIVKKQKDISEYTIQSPFKFLYVSTVHIYKHQWSVVKAIADLRLKGYPVELTLIGEVIFQRAGNLLKDSINQTDPSGEFINYKGHISYSEIEKEYASADGIIFASTCENMPNILIESMASGVPIACSDKQPMPEFLKKNGIYFNSKNIRSIQDAIEKLILNKQIREEMANKNLEEVCKYSWKTASEQTFKFLIQIYNESNLKTKLRDN